VTAWVSCLSTAWYFVVLTDLNPVESGPDTADQTTNVVHKYIEDISLLLSNNSYISSSGADN